MSLPYSLIFNLTNHLAGHYGNSDQCSVRFMFGRYVNTNIAQQRLARIWMSRHKRGGVQQTISSGQTFIKEEFRDKEKKVSLNNL